MPDETRTFRTEFIDCIKLFAILCIVFNHSIRFEWDVYKILTNDFQNPLLFFASGFIFSFCIYDLGKYRSFGEVFIKKCRRLIRPYILTLTCYFLPVFLITADERYTDRNPLSILLNDYLFGINADALWFLLALFIIQILAYLARDVFRYRHTQLTRSAMISILLFLGYVNLCSEQFPVQFCLYLVARYAIFFVAGYFFNICKFQCTPDRRFMTYVCLVAAAIYILDYSTGFLAGSEPVITGAFGITILKILELVKQFCLVLIIWKAIEYLHVRIPSMATNSVMVYVRKHSFDIYIYHWPVLLALLKYMTFIESPMQRALCTGIIVIVWSLLVSELLRYVRNRLNGVQ